MTPAKKIRYEVRISARQQCAPDKSKYNMDFMPNQPAQAQNYFRTAAERFRCGNPSKVNENTSQATGELYIVTLTTILEK